MDIVNKPLFDLNDEEWESLCDGCGLCCMHKFQDEDTDEVLYTNVACRLFDAGTCRCKDYAKRSDEVPDCLRIRQFEPDEFAWLPATCAYRLRYEGKPLYDWHPLVSGKAGSVHDAGISMQDACVSELDIEDDELPLHIIDPVGE